MAKEPRVPEPWMPAPYFPEHSYAMQALARGEANDAQQKMVVKWLIEVVCGTYDEPYRIGPDGDRNTAYALGKRHVGLQIVKHVRGVPGLAK